MTGLLDLLTAAQGWSEPVRLAALVVAKSTLVLGLALALAAALGRRSAALRHLVLAVGLAGAVAIPLIAFFAPPLELALLPAAPTAISPTEGSAAAPTATATGDGSGLGPAVRGETSGSERSAAVARESEPIDSSAVDWGIASLLVLIGISALSILYLAVGVLLVLRIHRRSTDLGDDPAWSERLDVLRQRLRVRRPVALRRSADAEVPLTLGALRPKVIIPAEAERWSDAERRAVLLHELGHVARWDWPVQIVARLACALYWFNPLAWIACRRLLIEAERACDDVVLDGGQSGPGYAKQLLELASRRRTELPTYGAVTMARRATLSQRIQAILDPGQRRGALGRHRALALAATALAVVLVVAPARLVRSAAAENPGSEIDGWSPTRLSSGLLSDADADADIDIDFDEDFEAGVDEAVSEALGELLADAPPLLVAAHRGDQAEVERLLAGGANPNQGAVELGTPLIAAAAHGDREIVRLLLDAGASPDLAQMERDLSNDLPRSPLGAAAQSGEPAVVALLLDAGADPFFAPRGDGTPLMIASENAHSRVVAQLLAAGAAVDTRLAGDGSALIAAARGGDHRIVQQLLQAGADPDLVVEGDGSPLIAAVRHGDPVIVSDLLEAGADPNRWVEGDESPLYHAVASGQDEAVRLLLDAGADPNAVWPGDGTPLLVATRAGAERVVQRLVEAGARADLGVDGDGNALIAAAAQGRIDVLRRMILSGADPDAAVRGDGSPLIAAAREGHLDAVRLLVEAGADVDRVVPGDENPLIQAAGEGHAEVVRYLLDGGADPSVEVTVRRWDGRQEVRSPLTQAQRGGHQEIVEMLSSRLGAGRASGAHAVALGSEDDGGADAWLVVDAARGRLVVPAGSVVEVVGTGRLEFPSGSVSVAIPADHRLRLDGRPLDDQVVARGEGSVEVIGPDGQVAWRLRRGTWAALDGPGTRIEDSDRRRQASVETTSTPMRFFLAVDDAGHETFFEPAG